MADALLHAELLAACSALGYSDGIRYNKEADCLETIKDLLRFLRKDDESHEVRRALGETRVLRTDLLPLIRDHSQESELFDKTVRLLVNLTNPALLLFREELPEEKVTRQQFLQLITQQQGYKEAFVDDKVWGVLVGRLGELLQLEWEERQEEDKLLIERIFILVRNVLSVPASPEDEKRTDDDASIHDQVLWALHLSGFEDLLLYVASSENEQDLYMVALEIISIMLREQDPSQLASAGIQRSQSEKKKDERELLELLQREAVTKQQQRQKYYGARHSKFGGTYYVQNMKSISDNNLILHQPLNNLKSLNFDRSKCPKKHRRDKVPMRETSTTRRSTLAIRLFLQEFCIEFLNGAYNSIMYAVKDNLNSARAQEHDESYYMWSIKFFLEFNRHHEFKIELVSETISIQTFHYIQTHLERYFEMMTTDKKKIPLWSRRMHKAVRAYQELLLTLAAMDKSQNESVRESSKVVKSKVFYVVEYREMVLFFLQNYDPLKMTENYLKDIIETTHIFIKLLEGFCGKSRHIMVQQAKKARKKKVASKNVGSTELSEGQLQDLWDEMAAELSAVVQGEAGDLPDTIPFDTLSEQTEDEQKELAMRRINKLLRDKEMTEAVSLMRSSREVWPEGDIFGSPDMDPTGEFLALREIFMANLNPAEEVPVQEEYDEDDDEEEEESMIRMSEQEFDFPQFVRRFANAKVMESYGRLLKRYQSNSSHTNHCILKMFHRIAWDQKLPAVFFQASLFCVFRDAMEKAQHTSNESLKEIVKFGKYIFHQFLKTAKDNPKVFVELLFWKTSAEAVEIECGYGTDSGKAVARAWREEEEEELRRLFEEFDSASTEDRGGKDTVDLILENLINQTRTRRMVLKKLKDLGLIASSKDIKLKPTSTRAPKSWSEEEEGELRMLFEEYKDAVDIIGRIMDHKMEKRPKHRIIEKILELGLVTDRKALYKKRAKKDNVKPRVDTRHLGEQFIAANQASDDNDSERDDEGSDNDRGIESSHERRVPEKSSRQPSYVPPLATPALMSQALTAVLEANMQEAVEWISRILRDVADDREEDGDFEPVPVLAITEACTDAMEDESFQKLLKLVGVRPPQNHEEKFWRIPSRLSVDALRKRAQYLQQGASEGVTDIESELLEPVEEKAVKKVKAPKVPKPRQSKPKNRKQNKQWNVVDLENVDPEDKENFPVEVRSRGDTDSEDDVPLVAQRSQRVEDSSEDEVPLSSLTGSMARSSEGHDVKKRNVSDPEESDTTTDKVPTQSRKKRRLILNDDSDEESPTMESDALVLHLDTESTESEKQTSGVNPYDNVSGEASVQKTPKSRRLLGSDSEDEDELLVSVKQRPRAIIDSDDDE